MTGGSDKETLLEFGFNEELINRALKATKNSGLQPALDWINEHQDDPEATTEIESDATKEEVTEDSGQGEAKALVCNDCGKLFPSVETAQLHAARTSHQDFSESTEARPELTPEEKTARLAELKAKLAEKRHLEEVRAANEARQAEAIRRKSGQAAQEARRETAEREMKKAADQARKDKEDEKRILARIRAEMEEEKRIKREAKEMKANNSTQQPTVQEPIKFEAKSSDSVRIQVKLPGGEAIKETFKSEEKLSALIEKINEKFPVSGKEYLVIPFPHKVISIQSDNGKTFLELGLCPSASLLLE